MNLIRFGAAALLLAGPLSAAAQDVQSFDYTMRATTQELWQVTTRARVKKSWTLWHECTLPLIGRVECVTDRYQCHRIDLGTGESFPESPADLQFTQFEENDGGEVRFLKPPDYLNYDSHDCKVGVHRDAQGQPYMNVLYKHDGSESYSRVRIEFWVDLTDVQRHDRAAVDEHAGSASLDLDELKTLPPEARLRYVAPFAVDDGVLGSGGKRCTGDVEADLPECVLEAPKPGVPVSYSVGVTNPEVLPIMLAQVNEAGASCGLDQGNANGDRLCATVRNLALARPPAVFLTAIGEGVDQDGEIVARAGENVCFFETHLSFASDERITWRRHDASGGSATFQPAFQSETGRWCSSEFPPGRNTVVLEVADANGTGTAEQSFKVTRGPVGLLHGYLLGDPDDFDDLAARLESEGFETYRMDLRRRIRFRTIGRYPIPFSSGDVKVNPEKPGERFLGRKIEVKPNVLALPDAALHFPGFLNTLIKWLAEVELPDWLPFMGNRILPEEGIPLGKPASIGPAFKLGCVGNAACFTGQFMGSVGLRLPGESALDPETEQYTDERGALLLRIGLSFSVVLPEGTVLDPKTQSFQHPVSVGGYEVGTLGLDWHNRYWGQQGEIYVAPFVEITSPAFGFRLANGDLFEYQGDVKAFVDTTLEKSGYHHMSLFGHDMGAVIARMYTARAPVRDQVNKLLMTGGPQRGSDTVYGAKKATKWLVAWLSTYTGPFAAFIKYGMNVFVDAIYGDAGKMLEPHSTFLQGLNNNYTGEASFDEPRAGDAMAPDVAIYNYVGRHYLGDLGPTLTHVHTGIPYGGSILGLSWKLPNVDEFVVPWVSLTGDMIVSSPAARVFTGGNVFQTEQDEGKASWHFRLAKDDGSNFANFIRDLEDPYRAPPLVPPPATARASARSQALADPALTPDARDTGAFEVRYAEADLRPGESVTLAIVADRTAMGAIFTTQSIGNVHLSVRTPGGPRLQGGAPDPLVGASAVAIDAMEPGTWVATATLDPAAPLGAYVQLSAALRSRAFLALKASGPTRTQSGTDRVPGEDVHVGAVFLQGHATADSATVRCGVHAPDGSEHEVPLFDDGGHEDEAANDGFHVGVVPGGLLQREGSYQVTCDAIGAFSGEVVERSAELQLRVRRPSDHGIVPGSVRVDAALPGRTARVRFEVFNHGAAPVRFLPVQVTEKIDGGPERVIGCKAFSPLASGATERATFQWELEGDACRTVTAGITGTASADEVSNDPQARPPYDDNIERVRVCPPPRPAVMTPDAGGPYRYGANDRIVLDATGSQNTTERTIYRWTLLRVPDLAVLAEATGRQAVVTVPGTSYALAKLTLNDPERGTAMATAPVTYAGATPFPDRSAPDAVLVAPETAFVGEPVVLRSESTDDFGTPPLQTFRIPDLVVGDGTIAMGRSARVVFPAPGDYEVILDVQDGAGHRSSAHAIVRVEEKQPTVESVIVPATFEQGVDLEVNVQLGGVSRLAGAPVRVSFGVDPGTGEHVRTSIAEASTDACGFARVELPGPVVPSDLIVEVIGTGTCDPETGACLPGVAVVNPTGRPVVPVDTVPPEIRLYEPAPGTRAFDACEPIALAFGVSDDGSGVAPGSTRARIDDTLIATAGDCAGAVCRTTINPAGLTMGSHTLWISARDLAGNVGALRRDFRLEATLDTLVCRLESPVCAGVAPDGFVASLLAHLDAARRKEADGDLRTAANDLAALLLEVRAQAGNHLPSTCAETLEEAGIWIIGTRWGQSPRQVYAALGATLP